MAAARKTAEPTSTEIIGKFQHQNEQRLKTLAADMHKGQAGLAQKVGTLTDAVAAQRELCEELKKEHQAVVERTARSEKEAVLALRETVKQAKIAAEAAQVYETIRDAQPDYEQVVQALRRELGECRDRLTHAELRITELSGTVHGMGAGLVEVAEQSRVHATRLTLQADGIVPTQVEVRVPTS